MTKEELLTQAYDAEQRGDLKEAERLRRLARETKEDAAAAMRLRRHRQTLYFPWQPN